MSKVKGGQKRRGDMGKEQNFWLEHTSGVMSGEKGVGNWG